jgi:hypothetical protein
MDQPMTKARLMATLREERTRWDALVKQVEAPCMLVPGPGGEWSVKDIVAHISAYERLLVDLLRAASRRELLPLPETYVPDMDERNALLHERNKDRALQDVMAESARVYVDLLETLQVVPEEDFTDAARTAWFVRPFWGEAVPLWEYIAGDTYEHYREHTGAVQRRLEAAD